MRLWTLHPKYLDSKGLVSAWREGLLAKAVLEDRTRGYRHHPQLQRFRENKFPVMAMNAYLVCLLNESLRRGYSFDRAKVSAGGEAFREYIEVAEGQVAYEWRLLLHKLGARDEKTLAAIGSTAKIEVNDIFVTVEGPVASWEKVKDI